MLGFSVEKQLAFLGGFVTVTLIGAIGSLYLIQKFSRPYLIAAGLFGCAVCLAAEAGLVAEYATRPESILHPNNTALQAAVAVTYIFIICMEAGPGGAEYVYIAEIFPTHIRSQGMGICISGLSLMNVIWLQVAPTAFEDIGWKFYLVFICCTVVAIVLIIIYCPDTNQLPLESIAVLFGDEIGSDIVTIQELKGYSQHHEVEVTQKEEA